MAAQRVSGGLEDELWLVPIEDRRERGALREGMRSGFTLGQYLMLVEYTGRMLGRFLAASRERLRQLASKLNVRHLANVG